MTNQELVRAIRGPIVLITIGVLFALEYFGSFPFHRTWPVLLIVFGVLKLAERTAARSKDYEQDSPFGGHS